MSEKIPAGWAIEANTLKKLFKFKGFAKTMSFVNSVAWLAQDQKHHPDMHISYNYCLVELTTHDEGNKITQKDLVLSHAIEKLVH